MCLQYVPAKVPLCQADNQVQMLMRTCDNFADTNDAQWIIPLQPALPDWTPIKVVLICRTGMHVLQLV